MSNVEENDSSFTPNFLKSLTPRSTEACKRLGVLPDELCVRPFEAFRERGLKPEIQKLRYTEHEALRQDTIENVRSLRHELVQSGWGTKGHGNLSAPKAALDRKTSSNSSKNNVMISKEEQEHRRLESIRKRQEKELENMMAYEVRMAEMVASQEKKVLYRQQKEAEAKKLREEEALKLIEKARVWQLAKIEEEKKEKIKNDQLAQRMVEQEERYQQDLKVKEEARQREAAIKQEERRRKKIELKKRNEEIDAQLLVEAEERRIKAEQKEQRRLARMEHEKRLIEEANAAEAAAARERVRKVMEENDRILEQKRMTFTEKMKKQSVLQNDLEERLAAERAARAKAIQDREKLRLQNVDQLERERIAHFDYLGDKERKIKEIRAQLDQAAQEQQEFRTELQRLARERKERNRERIERQEQYRREKLIERVNEDARRAKEMEEQQERMMKERQAHQIKMMNEKRALLMEFENVRKGATKSPGKLAALKMSASSAHVGNGKQKQLGHSKSSTGL